MIVFCLFGKRKSGKDFCAQLLKKHLDYNRTVEIRHISDPLKEEFAHLHDLDAEVLKTSGPEKEAVRLEMVKFGEDIRKKDIDYFCEKAVDNLPPETEFLIIPDCRRPTDIQFFKKLYSQCRIFVIRVEAEFECRCNRGWVYQPHIDNAESECALDGYDQSDFTFFNNDADDVERFIAMFCKSTLETGGCFV